MKITLTDSQKLIQEEINSCFNVDFIPDAVLAVDNESTILIWNKAAEKLYGYKKSEVIGKKSFDSVKTRTLKGTLQATKDFIKKQGHWNGEVLQYRKDGSRLFISALVQTLKNDKNEQIGTITFNRDISQHKQIEYNLRFLSAAVKTLSSSLDYQTTLNKVAQLAVPRIADWCSVDLLNEQGELLRVAIAHRDPEKIKLADELRKINPPNLKSDRGLAKVIKTGLSEFYPYISPEMIEATAINKKHLTILKKVGFTGVIIVPIASTHTKKPIGAITFVNAESKRRYTESDLQTAEKLAAQASFAIENARLYHNAEQEITERKKVEERMREMESRKDNFISMASHELKTPITSLKIYSELLEKQLKKDGLTYYDKTLTIMKNQMNKLNMLIVDLLNLSKIQAGKLELRMDTFDLSLLIHEIVEQIQPTTSHDIKLSISKSMPVYGDRDRIGQVLINLLTNAIKYSPEQGNIIISAVSDKMGVRVEVRDFGVGISKEHQKKIFERFYQIESRDKTYPGLGMGLYISLEIITRHMGSLWVEKAKGKGSVFIFTIPKKATK